MRFAALSLITGFLLGSAGVADEPTSAGAGDESNPKQSSDTVDTVVFTRESIAAGIGYTWGHGELVYDGQKQTFSVCGLSVVDVGVVNISASGVLYNLRSLDDLSGNYTAASAGLTALRFNLAAHGVNIKLTG